MADNISFMTQNTSGKIIKSLKEFSDNNKDLCTRSSNIFEIDAKTVQIQPGFNTREMGMGEAFYKLPEVVAHIQRIKQAYIRHEEVEPVTLKIIDGKPFIRQGNCRLRAALDAISEGHNIIFLAQEFKGDETAAELHTLDGNKGMPLSAVAKGESYKRMTMGMHGWSISKMAAHEDTSEQNIRSLIALTTLPVQLKKHIHSGVIAYTFALELFTEHGATKSVEYVEQKLNELMEAQKSQNSTVKLPPKAPTIRITKKSLGMTKVPSKLASIVVAGVQEISKSLHTQLEAIPKDQEKATVELDRQTIDLLIKLQTEIRASEQKKAKSASKKSASKKPADEQSNDVVETVSAVNDGTNSLLTLVSNGPSDLTNESEANLATA